MTTPLCRYCGKKLTKQTLTWDKWSDFEEPKVGSIVYGKRVVQIMRTKIHKTTGKSITFWTGGYGKNSSGVFCSYRCGFKWAVDFLKQE